MSFHFLSLLTAFFSLFISITVYYKGRKRPVNISFALFALFSALWSASLYFYIKPIFFSSLLWIKIVYLLVFGMIAPSFYFSFVFPTGNPKKALVPIFLYFVIAIPFIYILFFTNLWVKQVVLGPWEPATLTGPAYLYWGLFNLLTGIWLFTNLYLKYKKSRGLIKAQIRYVFFGIYAFAIGTIMVDVLLPVLIGESRFFWASSLFLLPFLWASSYAIVKHRLMDIRLVIARAVSYTLLSLILVSFYTAGLFFVGQWLFPGPLNGHQLVLSIILGLTAVYTFPYLKNFLDKVTVKIFFKEHYEVEELLEEISEVLSKTLNLNELIKDFLGILLSTMHVGRGGVILTKRGLKKRIIAFKGGNQPLDNLKPIEKKMRKLLHLKKEMVVFDDLKEGWLKKFMRENQIGFLGRLDVKKKTIGILFLGQRLSGDIYTNDDFQVLEILAPQLAVAIQNAQQYEEIKQFSEKLKDEVKKATLELRTANKKLKELDKKKDEFVSVAAHELRAPMSAIKGYLSMVLEGDAGKMPLRASEFLQEASEGNERLIRLVNNMLNVSRIEEGRMVYQMGVVGLGKVAKTVFEEFRLEAKKKGLKILLNIPSGLRDQIFVDQDRIHEVVANLVSNAVKYTDKGSVTIRLSCPRQAVVRLEVRDTGFGIAKKEQEKLFQKFARTESSTGDVMGTGLGLYIAKLLIKKFGGRIGFESPIGKGSTFWFELPVSSKKSV